MDFGVLEIGKSADGAPHLLTSSHTWISFSNKDYQWLSSSPSQVLQALVQLSPKPYKIRMVTVPTLQVGTDARSGKVANPNSHS